MIIISLRSYSAFDNSESLYSYEPNSCTCTMYAFSSHCVVSIIPLLSFCLAVRRNAALLQSAASSSGVDCVITSFGMNL